jgi:hypothetical protein
MTTTMVTTATSINNDNHDGNGGKEDGNYDDPHNKDKDNYNDEGNNDDGKSSNGNMTKTITTMTNEQQC